MTNLLFIQGGGAGAHAEDAALVASLERELGRGFTVIYPSMPEHDDASPAEWIERIAAEIAAIDSELVLVAHSVGCSMLMNFLAEHPPPRALRGVVLLAAPYWGPGGWQYGGFALSETYPEQLPDVPTYLMHNEDDEIVPFAHLANNARTLPGAIVRTATSGGHQFVHGLSVAADAIRRIDSDR